MSAERLTEDFVAFSKQRRQVFFVFKPLRYGGDGEQPVGVQHAGPDDADHQVDAERGEVDDLKDAFAGFALQRADAVERVADGVFLAV